MKISRIEFQNFRNFKERNVIECSTDGKVTIIYGDNGDGKTTLHQLFQWIFYNKVHFNKTTTDKMYNLEFEQEQEYNTEFSVIGSIDFEHNCESYSLRREWKYIKGLMDSKKVGEDLSLNKRTEENDWKRLPNPEDVIEDLLPSGLSEYFFFDGESMIADLKVKGKDSANKFRKALYSIFDLDILENAVSHIGETSLKTTVLGQLYLAKGSDGNDSNVSALKTNIENAQRKIEELKVNTGNERGQLIENKTLLKDFSEKIGSTKSHKDYEQQRKQLQTQRDAYLAHAETLQAEFGDEITRTYPQLLISKVIDKAKETIHLKMDETQLIPGLTKKLIHTLGHMDTCICGKPLCQEDHELIESYLKMFPPFSFKDMYAQFTKAINSWEDNYDRDKLEQYISQILELRDKASDCDKLIIDLDNQEKNSDKAIQKMIDDRVLIESRISDLEKKISDKETQAAKYGLLLTKYMKKYDEATEQFNVNKIVNRKISIMTAVKDEFKSKLEKVSTEYSDKLKEEIQYLLDTMLNSKRTVTVSSDFYIRVFDKYDDESKSEGQFAVVSFAYIGGILSLLKKVDSLNSKEYPLVLDGPFSKLGDEHRKNVINTIPDYAPQIIIFSKDNLQSDFAENKIGKVWTIKSNAEKNVSSVKEGFLW